MSHQNLASVLAVCSLLALACDSGSSGGGGGGGGPSCRSFCSSFASGANCQDLSEDDCKSDCDSFVQQCPDREDDLLACLEGLSYECLDVGVAIGHGDGQGTAYLQGSQGSLEIQDGACAEAVDAFYLCDQSASP